VGSPLARRTDTPHRRPGGRGEGVSRKLDANGIETGVQPVHRRPSPVRRRIRIVGSVRIPLAGPYRPLAELVRFPDGRLLWRVRLWEVDRAVPHLVPTERLVRYARESRLADLERAVHDLVHRAAEVA
jgi:hypothetical protein